MASKLKKTGSIESIAAKCGLSSSKLLVASILAVFVISASYVFFVYAIPNAPGGIFFTQNSTLNYDSNGIFTVNWSAVTNDNISNYSVYIINNTGGLIIAASNTSATGYYFVGVNDGANYTFNISAVNASGIVGPNTTSSWMFVDTVAPSITALVNPQNGATVSNKQTLAVNLSVLDLNSGASVCRVNIGNVTNITGAISNNWCNVTGVALTGLALGAQTINIYINDSAGNLHYNNSYAVIVGGAVIPGSVQWNASKAMSINLTGRDMFFYDGDTIPIIANFTTVGSDGVRYPYDNLTILKNSTSAGDGVQAVTPMGGGLYNLTVAVNYSNITGGVSQFAGASINLLIWNSSGQPVNLGYPMMEIAVLVNMSTIPSCPPDTSQIPPVMPWNSSLRNVTSCIAADASPCSTISAPIYQNANGSVYLCGPVFGSATTNFSYIAQTGSFSAVPLVIDVPGKAKINFSANPVDMSTQEKSSAIMQFAMKNLMSRGQFGINNTEWNGIGGKPNLTAGAMLTLYNISGLLGGLNHYSIGHGTFNGMEAPTDTSGCTPSFCSGMSYANGNLTFAVSSFSTYVIGAVNYTLRFANISGPISRTVVESANATYYINISNSGNNTDPVTYNLSAVGTGTNILNQSNITLNSTAMGGTTWQIVALNVSSATPATYTAYVKAVLSDGADIIFNSTVDGLNAPIITTVSDTTPPVVVIDTPANGATLSYRPYINGTAIDAANALAFIKTNNSTMYSGLDNSTPFNFSANAYADGTYTINVSANDTSGNTGWANVTFTVDTTVPTITIQSPAATPIYTNESIWFNITGSETLNWSAYSLDGIANVSLTNSSGNWNNRNTTVTQGAHTVVFWANDSLGNMNSATVSFRVDTIAPSVIGGLATPASANPGATVKLNVSVTDANTSQVFVNLSSIGGSVYQSMTMVSGDATNGVYEYNETIPNYTLNGTYALIIRANDTAGNLNTTQTITLAVNNVAPSVTVNYPNSAAYVKGAITANATVTDNNGNSTIKNVTFYYTTDGITYTFIGWQNATPGNQVYNVSWDTSALNIANVTLFVNATDGANWANDVSDAAAIIDNAAPSFSAITVTGGDIYAGNFNFSATITEPYFSSASYRIINATNSSIVWALNTSGIASNGTFGSAAFDGIYLPVGNWSINVSATDLTGNTNSTAYNITSYPAIRSTYDSRAQAPGTIGSGTAGIYNFTTYTKGYAYIRMYLNLTSGSDKFATAGNTLNAKLYNSTDFAAIDDEGSYDSAATLIIGNIAASSLPGYATGNITAGVYKQAVQLYLYPYSGLSAGTYSGNFGFGISSTQ